MVHFKKNKSFDGWLIFSLVLLHLWCLGKNTWHLKDCSHRFTRSQRERDHSCQCRFAFKSLHRRRINFLDPANFWCCAACLCNGPQFLREPQDQEMVHRHSDGNYSASWYLARQFSKEHTRARHLCARTQPVCCQYRPNGRTFNDFWHERSAIQV